MRVGLLLVGVVGTMVLAAGCGTGPATAPPVSAPASGAREEVKAAYFKTPEECQPGKEHWREPGPPVRGGTIVRSGGELPNLNIVDAARGGDPGPQVYQTLVTTRGCYYGDTVMVPLLAQSWQIAPDGLTFTIKLRDGVKWHNIPPVNGRAFTSADVAYSIDYHSDPRSISPARATWQGVTHEEPDASTVVLRLPRRDADFVQKLGQFRNVMLPREVAEQEAGLARMAIGTGPFMFDPSQWKGNNEHTTVRNPDYYETGIDGKPLPYMDAVRNIYFADYIPEVAAFRSGQLDRTGTFGLLQAEAEQYWKEHPNAPKRPELQLSAYSLWFNLEKAPWNDVRVRRAVSMALDRDDLIASNSGGAVYGGFVPSSMLDYTWPDEKKRERFRSDPEGAKRLLAEAGYGGGIANVSLITGGQYQQDAEVVQHQLEAVGINAQVIIEGRSWGPIFNQRKIADLGWGGFPGGAMLSDMVQGLVETNNPGNLIHFSDPEVDRLARLQAGEYDDARRKELVNQLQDRLYDQMPYVPAITRVYNHFYSCRVHNIPWTKNTDGHIGLRYYWLDDRGC